MAIAIRQAALCRRAYMSEDQRRGGLRGQAFEIDTVPCWDRGSEDAGLWTELGMSIVTNSKAVTVMWSSSIL